MASGAEIYTLVADFRHSGLRFIKKAASIPFFVNHFLSFAPILSKIILEMRSIGYTLFFKDP